MDTKKKKPAALFAAPLPRTGSTIFHTHVERLSLLNELDSAKRIKRVITGDVAMLAGPKGEDLIPEEYSQAFAQVMSLYPLNVKVGTREGDPICDSYRIHTSDTGSIWCLTDGCNWGPRPFQAANRARDAFISVVQSKINEAKTYREVGQILLNGLASAHFTTIHDKADPFMAGTTTALGGIIARVEKQATSDLQDGLFVEETEQWVVIHVSVGDCKLFLYSAATGKVIDMTSKNREEVEDAKDPGGRIGPYLGDGDPDLRNLAFGACEVSDGDILIAVSDGVHDNLDPPTLGMVPSELGFDGKTDHADWKNLSKEESSAARTKFMCTSIAKIVSNLPRANPALIAKALVRHCQEVTEKSRDWMEQNPDGVLAAQSYAEFPGKMDHCSCVAIRVGKPNSGDHKAQSLRPAIFPY